MYNLIINLILSQLNSSNIDQVKAFLLRLSNGNDYERRLLICLGIDVKNNLIDSNTLQLIFDNIDFTQCTNDCINPICQGDKCTNHCIGIGCMRLLCHYENAILANNRFVSIIEDNSIDLNVRFSRVMPAPVFIEHFYNKNKIEGINNINHTLDIKDEIERGNLLNVKMSNSGNPYIPRNFVWATPLDEIHRIIEPTGNSANEVVNRLGLPQCSQDTEYVYFEYDPCFDETMFQPCHLSTCWIMEHLYCSAPFTDGYGRTRPWTGDHTDRQMREKIHFSIDDSSRYEYNVQYLGRVNNLSIDVTNLVDETMQRYTL